MELTPPIILLISLLLFLIAGTIGYCSEGYQKYLEFNNNELKMWDDEFKKDDKILLWAEHLMSDHKFISHLQNLSKKYNKTFTILGTDRDHNDRRPLNVTDLYFSPSRHVPNTDKKLFPIPQYWGKGYGDLWNSWDSKTEEFIWLGTLRYSSVARFKLFQEYDKLNDNLKKFCNFGITRMPRDNRFNFYHKFKKSQQTPLTQSKAKFILAIDGSGWPGNISWVFKTGSVAVIASFWKVWFMPLLRPWVDYVPLEIEYSNTTNNYYYNSFEESNANVSIKNFKQTISRMLNSPKEMELIAESGYNRYKQIENIKDEYIINIFKLNDYDEVIAEISKKLEF